MPSPRLQVRNLREVTAAMRAADKAVPRKLKEYLLPIGQMVATAAATKVPRRSGKAAASLSASSTQTGARVSFGGTKAPYFPWLDFGGSVGRGHEPGVPWSGAIKRPMIPSPDHLFDGRYVYPTIAEKAPEISEAALKAVLKAALDAQLGVE